VLTIIILHNFQENHAHGDIRVDKNQDFFENIKI